MLDRSIASLKKLQRLDLGSNEIEVLVSHRFSVHVSVTHGNYNHNAMIDSVADVHAFIFH